MYHCASKTVSLFNNSVFLCLCFLTQVKENQEILSPNQLSNRKSMARLSE